jgi:RNA polymerase sigma factor (sigma-70 family)
LTKVSENFWEKTYQDQISRLIGVCYRYVGKRQTAEDLTHDAFLKAMKNAKSFKGRGRFDSWLRKIVVNEALQYLRKQKREPYTETLNVEYYSSSHGGFDFLEDEVAMNSVSLSEQLEAISKLPDHHRIVFSMYVLDDYSHSQIAEILGISVGTSKSHLSRARKKLQKTLGEKTKRVGIILALSLPVKLRAIDRLYKRFDSKFEIEPQSSILTNLGIEKLNFSPEFIKPKAPIMYLSISVGTSLILISTIVIVQKNRTEQSKIDNEITAGTYSEIGSATISEDTIIHDSVHLNNDGMKNLCIAGSIFIASTPFVNEVIAQGEDSFKGRGNNSIVHSLTDSTYPNTSAVTPSDDSSFLNFRGKNYLIEHCLIVNESFKRTSKWEMDITCCDSHKYSEISSNNSPRTLVYFSLKSLNTIEFAEGIYSHSDRNPNIRKHMTFSGKVTVESDTHSISGGKLSVYYIGEVVAVNFTLNTNEGQVITGKYEGEYRIMEKAWIK